MPSSCLQKQAPARLLVHDEVLRWFEFVRDTNPSRWRGPVIELGSYDMNGSIRSLFDGCEYVGVDVRPGPGVDVVSQSHDVALREGGYAVVASTEMLEHDPKWRESIHRMLELVAPGGLVVITCAAPGRLPHGLDFSDHYRNISVDDAREVINSSIESLNLRVDSVTVRLSEYRSKDLHIAIAVSA